MKTAYEVLKDSGKLERNVIAAKVNGEVVDLTTPVEETAEATVTPLTFEDEEGKKVFWHTSSHVLAAAVKRLYPDVKLTIGPAIADGFYYAKSLRIAKYMLEHPEVMNEPVSKPVPVEL